MVDQATPARTRPDVNAATYWGRDSMDRVRRLFAVPGSNNVPGSRRAPFV